MPTNTVQGTIHFDPAGGPLSVRMLAAFASPGHYSLMLLEHDRFTIVKDFGNQAFSSPQVNTHKLPGAASEHDGRFAFAQTSVGVVDPNGQVAVIMTVIQDGKDLGSVTDAGVTTDETRESQLIGLLEKKDPTVRATAQRFEEVDGVDVKARQRDLRDATRAAQAPQTPEPDAKQSRRKRKNK